MVEPFKSICVLAYPDCGEQDTLAVWEIFASLRWVLSQQKPKQDLDLKLLGMGENCVKMQMGAQVLVDGAIDTTTTYDLLYVPGGLGSGKAALDPRIRDIVRRHHAAGSVVATNCSGISVLHRAGILGDTPVTSAATVSRRLLQEGANLQQPRRMWLGVPEARIWTTAGGSGVHASTVAMIGQYYGREIGTTIGMMWDTRARLGDGDLFSLEGPEYFSYPDAESKLQDDFEDQLLPIAPPGDKLTIHAPISQVEADSQLTVFEEYIEGKPLEHIELDCHNEMIILNKNRESEAAYALLRAGAHAGQRVQFPRHRHLRGERTVCLAGNYGETVPADVDVDALFEGAMTAAEFERLHPGIVQILPRADGDRDVLLGPRAQWSMGDNSVHEPWGVADSRGRLMGLVHWGGPNEIL